MREADTYYTAEYSKEVSKVIKLINELPDFEIVTEMDGNYEHMGATLTDAVLQSGINYETVVRPRVNDVKEMFPHARTTSGFHEILETQGVENVIRFRGIKGQRLLALTELLVRESVETEQAFASWLSDTANVEKLKQMNGIKDKTVDYLKILVGLETSAIDRHLIGFVEMAGIPFKSYEQTKAIIDLTADTLRVNRALMDHSIWRYMSSKRNKVKKKVKVFLCRRDR